MHLESITLLTILALIFCTSFVFASSDGNPDIEPQFTPLLPDTINYKDSTSIESKNIETFSSGFTELYPEVTHKKKYLTVLSSLYGMENAVNLDLLHLGNNKKFNHLIKFDGEKGYNWSKYQNLFSKGSFTLENSINKWYLIETSYIYNEKNFTLKPTISSNINRREIISKADYGEALFFFYQSGKNVEFKTNFWGGASRIGFNRGFENCNDDYIGGLGTQIYFNPNEKKFYKADVRLVGDQYAIDTTNSIDNTPTIKKVKKETTNRFSFSSTFETIFTDGKYIFFYPAIRTDGVISRKNEKVYYVFPRVYTVLKITKELNIQMLMDRFVNVPFARSFINTNNESPIIDIEKLYKRERTPLLFRERINYSFLPSNLIALTLTQKKIQNYTIHETTNEHPFAPTTIDRITNIYDVSLEMKNKMSNLIRTEIRATFTKTGDVIPYIPELYAFALVEFSIGKSFLLNINAHYIGRQNYKIDKANDFISDYVVWNTNFKQEFNKNIALFVSGYNLGDSKFESYKNYKNIGLLINGGVEVKF